MPDEQDGVQLKWGAVFGVAPPRMSGMSPAASVSTSFLQRGEGEQCISDEQAEIRTILVMCKISCRRNVRLGSASSAEATVDAPIPRHYLLRPSDYDLCSWFEHDDALEHEIDQRKAQHVGQLPKVRGEIRPYARGLYSPQACHRRSRIGFVGWLIVLSSSGEKWSVNDDGAHKGRLLIAFLTIEDSGRERIGASEISSGGSGGLSVDATDICYS